MYLRRIFCIRTTGFYSGAQHREICLCGTVASKNTSRKGDLSNAGCQIEVLWKLILQRGLIGIYHVRKQTSRVQLHGLEIQRVLCNVDLAHSFASWMSFKVFHDKDIDETHSFKVELFSFSQKVLPCPYWDWNDYISSASTVSKSSKWTSQKKMWPWLPSFIVSEQTFIESSMSCFESLSSPELGWFPTRRVL